MNVLIVGGTGLISTGITRALQEMGADVTHYNRGQAPSQLAEVPPTLHGDRRDFAAFEAQMAEAGPGRYRRDRSLEPFLTVYRYPERRLQPGRRF